MPRRKSTSKPTGTDKQLPKRSIAGESIPNSANSDNHIDFLPVAVLAMKSPTKLTSHAALLHNTLTVTLGFAYEGVSNPYDNPPKHEYSKKSGISKAEIEKNIKPIGLIPTSHNQVLVDFQLVGTNWHYEHSAGHFLSIYQHKATGKVASVYAEYKSTQ